MGFGLDALGAAHEHEPGVLAALAFRKPPSIEARHLVRLRVLGIVEDPVDAGMLHPIAGSEQIAQGCHVDLHPLQSRGASSLATFAAFAKRMLRSAFVSAFTAMIFFSRIRREVAHNTAIKRRHNARASFVKLDLCRCLR
jgi:hypothetical protein